MVTCSKVKNPDAVNIIFTDYNIKYYLSPLKFKGNKWYAQIIMN